MPLPRTLARLTVALTVALAAPPRGAAQPNGQPVTFPQVLNLVELKIDDDAILKRLHGTTFVLDAGQEQALRKAGASDRLIQALKAAPSPARAEGTANWVFILDCSGSMQEATPDGVSKMEAAKKAVISVLKNTPNGLNVGFVIYGHDAALKCEAVKVIRPLAPLDDDGKADLALAVTDLKPTGHTPIALALQVARKQLEGRPGAGGVVLITDGMETCHGDPVAEAGRLNAGHGVNVVGFGLTADEAKAVRAIAAAGKGKYHDARSAAELAKEMAVVQATVRETAAAKPAPKADPSHVRALGETTVDKPAALEPGTTGQATLNQNASAYAAVRLAAGTEYKVIVDVRQGRSTNIQGSVSLLDEDGAEVSRDLVRFNEIDSQFRYVARVSVKAAGKYIVRVTNANEKASVWLTVAPVPAEPAASLTAADLARYDPKKPGPVPVPFCGDKLPELIRPGDEVTGRLDQGCTAYYAALLPKGDYKAVVGLTNAADRNTNIQGYLALLDGDGGGQHGVVKFNEIDVTSRKSGGFTLTEPGVVILRLQVGDEPMKYTLRLRPAAE